MATRPLVQVPGARPTDFREILSNAFAQTDFSQVPGVAGGIGQFASGFGQGFSSSLNAAREQAIGQQQRDALSAILAGEQVDLASLSPEAFNAVAPVLLQRQNKQPQQPLTEIGRINLAVERGEVSPEQAQILLQNELRKQQGQGQAPLTDFGKINLALQRGEITPEEAALQRQLTLRPLRESGGGEGKDTEILKAQRRAELADQYGLQGPARQQYILTGNLPSGKGSGGGAGGEGDDNLTLTAPTVNRIQNGLLFLNESLAIFPDLIDSISRLTPADIAGLIAGTPTSENALVSQGIANDLLLQLKEVYNLGVLNGGDQRILQNVQGDVVNVRGFFQDTNTNTAVLRALYQRLQERAQRYENTLREGRVTANIAREVSQEPAGLQAPGPAPLPPQSPVAAAAPPSLPGQPLPNLSPAELNPDVLVGGLPPAPQQQPLAPIRQKLPF